MNLLNVMLTAGGNATGQSGNGGTSMLIMMILIIAIFYFFMIRPQSKRQKEEKKFREALGKGQEVVTIGGLHGKIRDVKETTVLVEVAHDMVVEVEKSAITMTANASQAAKDEKK